MSDALNADVARLVLLVGEFSTRRGEALNGLTKLAKLDFLVRYPVFLEALNQQRGISDSDWTPPRDVEREAVDSPMIRYKYGPFDNRYYVLIGGLVGRGLAEYGSGSANLTLRLTPTGHGIAERLRALPSWQDTWQRARFVRRHYDISGTRLKDLIYQAFPALVQQPIGSTIHATPREIRP